jgi:uncharacterized membrane protein (DUF485 family)
MNNDSSSEPAVKKEESTDFVKVANSQQFKSLMHQKKRFIVPITIFFLAFYFLLPLLTSYTTILESQAIGDITWAWIFAIAQFVMTWTLCMIYVKKSASYDEQAEKIVEQEIKGNKG